MLGKLYVHVTDPNRFLLVRRELAFPHLQFRLSEWRVVAVGVEPMSTSAERSLQKIGYVECRVRLGN